MMSVQYLCSVGKTCCGLRFCVTLIGRPTIVRYHSIGYCGKFSGRRTLEYPKPDNLRPHLLMSALRAKKHHALLGNYKPEVSWQILSFCHHTQQEAKKDEKDDDDIQVVYRGPLQSTIKGIKLISLSTSFLGILLNPILLWKVWEMNAYAVFTVGIFSTFFVVVTPLLLHWVTKHYVIELLFDPVTKQFTAKTFTLLNQIKKLEFTASDVHVPGVPGVFTSFHAKKTPLFVDLREVIEPDAYSHMMGYDKPIDLHLSPSAVSNGETDQQNEPHKESSQGTTR